ncbi:MAG: hypothetical protein ACYSWO_19990 [Planctomycetota bacterium]|jgi:hypothetical protein
MFNSKNLRKAVLVATVLALAAGGVWATEAAKPRQRGGNPGMMWAIPARSLLCVRINKFEATLDSVNAFLKDIAPADAKAAAMGKLTHLLGDERLRGVNRKGNIAIFVLNVPGEPAAPGPMGNMFIGTFLPTNNYKNFVARNPNVGEADEQGISTIAANGKPMALAINVRRFALLCPPNAREQLLKVKKLLNQRKRSLGAGLDPDTRKQAASSPVWVYVNVKQASQMIRPMLQGGLARVKADLEKMKETGQGPPMDPAGLIDFYGGILDMALKGTDNVTIALAPSAEACKMTLGLEPIPDTMMEAMVGEPLEGDLDNMMGYLEDGSMFNVAAKVDHENLKTTYIGLFELMGKMMPDGLSETDLEQLQGLLTKGIDAIGDSLAVTVGVDSELSPPFVAKYVIKIKDRAAFEQVLEEELKLTEEGVLADIYKGFGMEMDVEVDRDAGTYKGVQIGGAKVAFKMGGDDTMQAKMIEEMFGDGLEYRWAFASGNCVYTVGGDADGMIRELIDQVMAGGPKEVGSEMKAALAAIDDSDQADVVGTLNYARAIRMGFNFMPLPEGVERPKVTAETRSNIAFAGRTTDEGKLAMQIVLPKDHLLEIKSVFDSIIPQIKEQERLQREKQKEKAQTDEM